MCLCCVGVDVLECIDMYGHKKYNHNIALNQGKKIVFEQASTGETSSKEAARQMHLEVKYKPKEATYIWSIFYK